MVGAGLAGLSTALALHKVRLLQFDCLRGSAARAAPTCPHTQHHVASCSVCRQVGIPAVVLERDAGLRLEGSAIALWSNAFRALAAVGVAQSLLDDHPPLRRYSYRCRDTCLNSRVVETQIPGASCASSTSDKGSAKTKGA